MKLLFIDCDGTIREPASGGTFISESKDQRIIKGADSAIKHYRLNGWTIVGITNQGGVAAGYKSLGDAIAEQQYTLENFPDIFRICFCPDFEGQTAYIVSRSGYRQFDADGKFNFRKPGAGMIALVIHEFIQSGMSSASQYLMVGDRQEDEQCAIAAGIDFMWANKWRESCTQN